MIGKTTNLAKQTLYEAYRRRQRHMRKSAWNRGIAADVKRAKLRKEMENGTDNKNR